MLNENTTEEGLNSKSKICPIRSFFGTMTEGVLNGHRVQFTRDKDVTEIKKTEK